MRIHKEKAADLGVKILPSGSNKVFIEECFRPGKLCFY